MSTTKNATSDAAPSPAVINHDDEPASSTAAAKANDEHAHKKQKRDSPLLLLATHAEISLSHTKAPTLNFAQRLMELLEKDDVKPYFHWCEDDATICIEDTGQFADEVLPKYFSESKFRSFMVRIKRWGFKVMTPSQNDISPKTKFLRCDLFKRNQPELCLLMGDERRVDRRVHAPKKAEDNKKDSSKKKKTNDNKTPLPVSIEVTPNPICNSAELVDSELARLNYQRHLQNIMNSNSVLGHYDRMPPSHALYDPSYVLGGGVMTSNISLMSIECDIQQCLETIAVQQERLKRLKGMKEMKLSLGQNRGGAGSGRMDGLSMLMQHGLF